MRRLLPLLLVVLFASACASPLQSLQTATLTTPWQTAGYEAPTRHGCDKAVALLTARALELKVTVLYLDLEEGHVGEFHSDTRTIAITSGMSSCGNLEVLAHELGHVLAPPLLFGHAEGQVFADGVSYLTVRAIGGYDPKASYARYLAGMKVVAPALLTYRSDIERAAEWLVKGGKRLVPPTTVVIE